MLSCVNHKFKTFFWSLHTCRIFKFQAADFCENFTPTFVYVHNDYMTVCNCNHANDFQFSFQPRSCRCSRGLGKKKPERCCGGFCHQSAHTRIKASITCLSATRHQFLRSARTREKSSPPVYIYWAISLSPHYDKEPIRLLLPWASSTLTTRRFFHPRKTDAWKKSPLCGKALLAWRRHVHIMLRLGAKEMHLIPAFGTFAYASAAFLWICMAAAADGDVCRRRWDFPTQSAGAETINWNQI